MDKYDLDRFGGNCPTWGQSFMAEKYNEVVAELEAAQNEIKKLNVMLIQITSIAQTLSDRYNDGFKASPEFMDKVVDALDGKMFEEFKPDKIKVDAIREAGCNIDSFSISLASGQYGRVYWEEQLFDYADQIERGEK